MDSQMEAAVVLKVIEDSHVSPPQGSVLPSTITLSYFDLFCLPFPHVRRLFLYSLPCSTSTFLETHIPRLKHSLSLTLQRFYPLAGHLLCDNDDGIFRTVSYVDGDSVAFTVAVCDDDDFSELITDRPRNITRFHSLVPVLPVSTDENKQAIFSIQVTLFPGKGFGIGTCSHHGLIDGHSLTLFLKTWASFSRSGCSSDEDIPSYDRSILPDSERSYNQVMEMTASLRKKSTDESLFTQKLWEKTMDTKLASFRLKKRQLEKLRQLVVERSSATCSFFALTSAVIWTCLVKIRREEDDDGKTDGFGFVSNCRARPNKPIPINYFGNCIEPCAVQMKRGELVGEDGWVKASVAIRNATHSLKNKKAPFDMDAAVWRSDTILTVAGSPNLGLYELDFGWGRVKKSEIVSIEKGCVMSISENRNEEDGGFEVGIVLPSNLINNFSALFQTIVLA